MDDKTIQNYRKLVSEETHTLFIEHFEGRKKFTEPLFLAVISIVLTILGLFLVNGNVNMSDIWNAVIPTIGVPLTWALIILIQSRGVAHVKIYKKQQDEATQRLNDNELELEKYNWNNIDFWITSFSIIGKSGWALEIKNSKHYDIGKVVAEITKIRKDEINIPLSGQFLLGYIDRQNGRIEDKIVNSSQQSSIRQGESREYVITSDVAKTKSSVTHQFETYPDKLEWEFATETNGGIATGLNRSLAAIAVAMYTGDNSPPDPVTVLEVCIKAVLDINDDVIILPHKKLNIQVHKDGSLSWYEAGDEKEG